MWLTFRFVYYFNKTVLALLSVKPLTQACLAKKLSEITRNNKYDIIAAKSVVQMSSLNLV